MALRDEARLPDLGVAQASLASAAGYSVSRETTQAMLAFSGIVLDAAESQNLISKQSVPNFWARHILDSAQLWSLAQDRSDPGKEWIDLGSGAGFPGIVLAILGAKILLVEERRLRVAFLERVCAELYLEQASIFAGRVEKCRASPAAIITARAYAPIDRLFETAVHLSVNETVWILPRGQHGAEDLAMAQTAWQGAFAMEPSKTDPRASILLARHVRSRSMTRKETDR